MTYSLPDTLPPLDCLAAAIAAARHGSFTEAAQQLGVTHAAVSRRVAAAEQWAGVRLFERHGRGVRTTDEGERLLARLAQAIAMLDQVAVRRPRSTAMQVIRLSTTSSFARYWLLVQLQQIEAASPGLRIEIDVAPRALDLTREAIDLAIRYGRGGWKLGAETKLLGDVLTPIASPRLARSKLSPSTIDKLPHLYVGDAVNWRGWSAHVGLTHRMKAADRFVPDYGLSIEAARNGLGVALWSRAFVLTDDLVPLSTTAFNGPYGYHLIVPPTASPAAITVASAIKSAARPTDAKG